MFDSIDNDTVVTQKMTNWSITIQKKFNMKTISNITQSVLLVELLDNHIKSLKNFRHTTSNFNELVFSMFQIKPFDDSTTLSSYHTYSLTTSPNNPTKTFFGNE